LRFISVEDFDKFVGKLKDRIVDFDNFEGYQKIGNMIEKEIDTLTKEVRK
jgi:hypothetical protein